MINLELRRSPWLSSGRVYNTKQESFNESGQHTIGLLVHDCACATGCRYWLLGPAFPRGPL